MTGTFLYYAIAVDIPLLLALSTTASEQANPTNTKIRKVKQFLNYAALYQYAIVMYHANEMILAWHSDVSYLSKPKARIRARGNFSYRRMTKPQGTMGRY